MRYESENIEEVKSIIYRLVGFYYNERLDGAVGYTSPRR